MNDTEVDYQNNYIRLNRKELINIMNESMSSSRYQHVLRVEQTALKLADKYDIDKEKVSIAALAHDYAKERPDAEMRDLIISENLELDMLQFGNNIWHGPLGAMLMKNEFELEDEEVLEAIKVHTIGGPMMGRIAQVIYIADYIEPKRSQKGVEKARELADLDLEKAVTYITGQTLKYLVKNKKKIYPKAVETYNTWVAKN
ncbi:MAG: bis(5'-nucleosyl)-tetraphosphatase (symmetrical) YqeK [Alkalibacterium sp.]|uniref:bis(5'-nucleosyl)-tetraphosphatase (symmetrical) n=1 Tax=Alkalibacterium gilvum TaxID=1130080 RepID=A0A1H6TPW6_9LACT|nr:MULTISPECIES: bis(5'-nucleosyl)-tetraphosphatase (symmetrical) YqeK [Alkalibacterium]MDN6293137.1 bis(5'-nucleosyl)-tetraphosphatase (symmetrical) YqeK [Alkalibacterium sp.]MDN6295050.1 bis(5'-nucleosyl)-tetraphosphatase (symmetrical) YqeK [Alkalibacterium sp.]MDN6327307.1 bis(5'-nucleosyl)-tetraphosphatase (symmetrical) YqeK [Alkalibacterium sp.]MDN6729964.1 bis(5'-nucleosyl)-tetraphosphatase (symmetrical) YqeK [Alkalibacterium sp.]SEI82129.1 putative HD superfamily hydrolase of NAD metabo